jgi:DNA-directed RNA polymerase subunit M
MQFCPKCGSVLVQKTKHYGCIKCGYTLKEKTMKIQAVEKMQVKKEVGVLHKKDSNVWPVTSATCPKCGHHEAYFWSTQMRAGDEGETSFYRCVKCSHTWREYR